MKTTFPPALKRWLISLIVPGGTWRSAQAQTTVSAAADTPATLEPVVVSASRSPEEANPVPSSVAVLLPDQLNLSQILTLRVENALNDKYEENPGWPALPFGVFGGVEWRF
jgi:hypothetical protein